LVEKKAKFEVGDAGWEFAIHRALKTVGKREVGEMG
jgi:hypothetical protein